MSVKKLVVADIEVDYSIQPRENGLNQDHVEELAEAYRAEADIPRPRVWKIGERQKLSQGFHRLEGAKRAGLKDLECELITGSDAECAIDAAASNQDHGLKRTNADKRLAAKVALKAAPDWSDSRIAETIGITDKTVASVRSSMSSTSEIPKYETRKDAKGKNRPAAKRHSNKGSSEVPKNSRQNDEKPKAAQKDDKTSPRDVKSDPESGKETNEGESKTKNDPDFPPLDQRFMPNANTANALTSRFGTWKHQLIAMRTAFRAEFPDRNAVMAKRIDSGQFDASLTELIDTIDRNIPECVCPCCCGTGDADGVCKYCDGFGIVDKHHHTGLKARWKKTRARLEELTAAAEKGGAA